MTCGVKAQVDTATDAAFTGATVAYNDASTPIINKITPRFGSIKGGDLITFEGERLTNPVAKLDGIPCVVQPLGTATKFTCIAGARN